MNPVRVAYCPRCKRMRNLRRDGAVAAHNDPTDYVRLCGDGPTG